MFNDKAKEAFKTLKKAFTTRPILRDFDLTQSITVETDASKHVYAGIISQLDREWILHPIAFYSKKMSPAHINYGIHDKELLAIMSSFEDWSAYLEGSNHQIKVL